MEPAQSPPAELDFLFQNRRAWIMGVVNVTPDSFYAGARTPALSQAVDSAAAHVCEGADLLDIGGQSTRPGAPDVSLGEELDRVLPVVDALRKRYPQMPLSIDTQKAEVARRCLALGAALVNDVSALREDPEMAGVVADAGVPLVLMHRQGSARTMQIQPHYEDVVDDIKAFFAERIQAADRDGIREDRLLLDPGIGFGKTLEHNITILKRLSEFLVLGRPLLVGISRKSFIGSLGASPALLPEDRLEGSLAAALWAVQKGARGIRVHDVKATRRALSVWEALEDEPSA